MDAEVGVIGLGAMGTATLWRLAARGVDAIGFEQFVPGNDRGSSHGDTRIIRTAYFEAPEYVPLVQEAFAMWGELQAESGVALLVETGGLMIGRHDSEVVAGALASAREHHLRHEVLDARQLRERYPQHTVEADEVAVLEPDAGYLRPEPAVSAMAARATALGARVETGCRVVAIEPHGDAVGVHTEAATFQVGRIAVTAGAWTATLLPALSPLLQVERNVMGWFGVARPTAFAPGAFPIFVHDLGRRPAVYGFPTTDGRTIKLAQHHAGTPANPDTLDRAIHPGDVAPLRAYIARHLVGVETELVAATACMYTNTPDRHFLIGTAGAGERVLVVSACSGHGFKFAPAIGGIAADLATGREPRHDLALFRPERFARLLR